jgi:hypothetical protein
LIRSALVGQPDAVIDIYLQAASAFVETAALIPLTSLDRPGLGEWTIRDLLGHTNRSITLIAQYASNDPVVVHNAAAYYQSAATVAVDPSAIAQRGRDAGAALGDDPMSIIRNNLDLTTAVLRGDPIPSSFATPFGVVARDAYLSSRIVELVTHTDDLTRAAHLPEASFDAEARVLVSAILCHLAVLRGNGAVVIAALTGRAALPDGFSVL